MPSHEAVDKNINCADGNVWRTKTVMHHGKRKDREVQALIKDHVAAYVGCTSAKNEESTLRNQPQ